MGSLETQNPLLSGPRHDLRRPLWTAIALLAVAWFAFPAFQATYTEGFQALISATARHLLEGRPQDSDLVFPFAGLFYLVTRLGVELLLGGLTWIDRLSAMINFRIVMVVSLAALVGSIVWILWRRYAVRPGHALLACMLFPTIFESSYFFNDSLPSAALSAVALAVFWGPIGFRRTISAAVFLGLAVTARLDAAFLAPVFLILLWFDFPDWNARIRHGLLAVIVVVVIPNAIYASVGLSFFDSFTVAYRAIDLWSRSSSEVSTSLPTAAAPALLTDVIKKLTTLRNHLLNGFALPGIGALALGLGSFLVERRWREIMLCVAVPLLYILAYNRSLYDVRYLLQLAPVFAIAMAEGINVVLRSGGRTRVAFLSLSVMLFASCLLPPALLPIDSDGPRPFLGRAWSPMIWSRWMGTINGGIAAFDKAIENDAAQDGKIMIVSGDWNSDRLAHLALIEHGFRENQDALPFMCRGIAESFRRGDASAIHIRTHLPFLRVAREGVTWEEAGLPCLDAIDRSRAVALLLNWITPAMRDERPWGDSAGTSSLYRPARIQLPVMYGSSVREFGGYYLDRVPIPAVGSLLRQPTGAAERRGALGEAAARLDLYR